VHGRESGFCLMIGGQESTYTALTHLWHAVAAPQGYAYVGPSGAGHYVKMVHNGIEYALLQAYAEGFHLLKDGSFANTPLDLEKITALWNTSSVIRSWILELTQNIFHEHGQNLDEFSGFVAESGMGKWTVSEAVSHHIPATLIKDALDIRYQSQKDGGNYATKLVALMRNQFGAHSVKKIREQE
jgi:6-phosphogluconate dehydrogenase